MLINVYIYICEIILLTKIKELRKLQFGSPEVRCDEVEFNKDKDQISTGSFTSVYSGMIIIYFLFINGNSN